MGAGRQVAKREKTRRRKIVFELMIANALAVGARVPFTLLEDRIGILWRNVRFISVPMFKTTQLLKLFSLPAGFDRGEEINQLYC